MLSGVCRADWGPEIAVASKVQQDYHSRAVCSLVWVRAGIVHVNMSFDEPEC